MSKQPFSSSGLALVSYETALQPILQASCRYLLVAPTGTGKTVGLPWWYSERREATVYVVLSKRLAATTAANYLREQLGANYVGVITGTYTSTHKENRIVFATAGVMVRLLQAKQIAEQSVILFDEFHERSIAMDLAFALADSHQRSMSFSLVVMSASVEATALADALDLSVIEIDMATSYAIDIEHVSTGLGFKARYDRAIDLVVGKRSELKTCLIFVPGLGEVNRIVTALGGSSSNVYPLHANCSDKQVYDALHGPKGRVVVATNVAESSITIADLDTVIDTGVTRFTSYQPDSDTHALDTAVSSQHSAIQRAGRVGRTKPGRVIRLWGKEQNMQRPVSAIPEISRSALEDPIVEALIAETTLLDLRLASYPSSTAIEKAQKRIDDWLIELLPNATLQALASLGLSLRYAMTLFLVPDSQINFWLNAITYLNLTESRQLEWRETSLTRIDFESLSATFKRHRSRLQARFQQIDPNDIELMQVSIEELWVDRIGYLNEAGRLVTHSAIYEVEGVDTKQPLLVLAQKGYQEPVQVGAYIKVGKEPYEDSLASLLSMVSCEDTYNPKSGRFIRRENVAWGRISRLSETASNHQQAYEAFKQFLRMWRPDTAGPFRRAMNRLNRYLAYKGQPTVAIDEMMTQDHWVEPWFESFFVNKPFNEKNLGKALLSSWLDYSESQQLISLVPDLWTLPTGTQVPVDYGDDFIRVTAIIQQLFGVTQHPQIAGEPIQFQFVSPAKRPIQLTSDLPGFWSGSYNAVRADMRSQYPKHYWPESPEKATPSNRSIKPKS